MAGNKPTGKQRRYLRALAERTGPAFSPPATKAAASRAIGELEGRRRSSRNERELDRDAVSHGLQRGLDGTAVRPAEVSGYGSNCRWRGREEMR